jgi:hypothetical protein
MGLHELAGRAGAAGDEMAAAAAVLAGCGPGAAAFGADAPGRLGELGRELHARCATALAARAREAAAHGARLVDAAAALRLAAAGYREAERGARARHEAEPR